MIPDKRKYKDLNKRTKFKQLNRKFKKKYRILFIVKKAEYCDWCREAKLYLAAYVIDVYKKRINVEIFEENIFDKGNSESVIIKVTSK